MKTLPLGSFAIHLIYTPNLRFFNDHYGHEFSKFHVITPHDSYCMTLLLSLPQAYLSRIVEATIHPLVQYLLKLREILFPSIFIH